MKKTPFLCTAVLAVAVFVGACDTHNQQDEFADRASATPSGYTNTGDGGQVISEDEDDWRTAPLFVGKVRVDPAYPNPVSTDFVTIPFTVLDFNAIRGGLEVRGFDSSGRFIVLDTEPGANNPGAYIFSFTPALLGRTGLHRLFIFDGFGEIVSYGDLLVQ